MLWGAVVGLFGLGSGRRVRIRGIVVGDLAAQSCQLICDDRQKVNHVTLSDACIERPHVRTEIVCAGGGGLRRMSGHSEQFLSQCWVSIFFRWIRLHVLRYEWFVWDVRRCSTDQVLGVEHQVVSVFGGQSFNRNAVDRFDDLWGEHVIGSAGSTDSSTV